VDGLTLLVGADVHGQGPAQGAETRSVAHGSKLGIKSPAAP
jgi:hypothetical protein